MGKVSKPFRPLDSQQAPWLAFFSHGRQRKTQSFFSIVKRKSYLRNIAEINKRTCLLHSHGWLLMIDWANEDEKDSEDCSLFNPRTMEKIQLPPIHLDDEFLDIGYVGLFKKYICALSCEPTEQNCVVLFMSTYKPIIIFCHLRENKWEKMQYKLDEDSGLFNFVTCRGKLYGLTFEGNLVVIDFHPNPVVKVLGIPPSDGPYRTTAYSRELVESCGEIFLVYKEGIRYTDLTVTFSVYKVDFEKEKWVEVESIGDRAFFLCDAHSLSCSASESGIEGNYIYYVDDDDPPILYRFNMTARTICMDLAIPNLTVPWGDPHWIFM